MFREVVNNFYEGQALKLDKMLDDDQELKRIEKELLEAAGGDKEKRDEISCLLVTYGLAVREKFYKKGFKDGYKFTKSVENIRGGIQLRSAK